jgi:integrase
MRMKLTADAVRKLTADAEIAREAIYWDEKLPGFGLRLRPGGSRTYIFQYKIGKLTRRMKLGSATVINFAKAQAAAKDLHARAVIGGDPAKERTENKQKASDTFAHFLRLYLESQWQRVAHGKLRESTMIEMERHLMKQSKALHDLQLDKIGLRDVAACLTAFKPNKRFKHMSGATTRNRVRTSQSAFFKWCIGEGFMEGNPVDHTNISDEASRNRVLGQDELRLIWNALPEDDYGAVIKLIMLTGQRPGEIAALERSDRADKHGNVEGDALLLPGARTKNHRDHVVALSGPAAEILDKATKELRFNSDGSPRELIFGRGKKAFNGWHKQKIALDRRIAEANGGTPIEHWTPHDLRRSLATHAAEKGIMQPHIIEAILNHISGHQAGVAGIYNRATYNVEKRTALALWAEHLTAIVEGRASNVTPLRREA